MLPHVYRPGPSCTSHQRVRDVYVCCWYLPALFEICYTNVCQLLLPSPFRTLLECRSNQRIHPKTDSRVPRCGVPLTSSNRVRGWAQWPRQISGPLWAHTIDLLGYSLQHHRSTASCGHSWKILRNSLLTLPKPSASRVNLWVKTTLIWAEGQMMPTLQASKMHSFLWCRSASSGFTGGGASLRRVLGGAPAKALVTKFWCSQELSDLPNRRRGIMAHSTV